MKRVERDYIVLPPLLINASDFGAPTVRTRAFFVGYLRTSDFSLQEKDFAPSRHVKRTYVRDAFRGLPRDISVNGRAGGWRKVGHHGTSRFAGRLKAYVPRGVGDDAALRSLRRQRLVSGFLGTVHSASVKRRFSKVPQGVRDEVSKSHRLAFDGFCPTMRAGTGSDRGRFQAVRPLHPTVDRVITPREAARLQGFPDWYQFSSTRWHSFRLIGGSVSPIVAERLLLVIRRALDTFEQE